MRRLAYADPPYPGQAKRYGRRSDVNLPLLVAYLRTFDGWALSTSTPALRELWNLVPEARCAAWCKTWTVNGWARVRYSWEPVLFVTDRRARPFGTFPDVWDCHVGAPDIRHGAWSEVDGAGGGRKPAPFVHWVLDLLDYEAGDVLEDVFPGSGAVTAAAGYVQLSLDALG